MLSVISMTSSGPQAISHGSTTSSFSPYTSKSSKLLLYYIVLAVLYPLSANISPITFDRVSWGTAKRLEGACWLWLK